MTEQQARRLPNNHAWTSGKRRIRLRVPECPLAMAIKTTKHGVNGWHIEVSGELLTGEDGSPEWWPGLPEAVAGLYRLSTGKSWWTSPHVGKWGRRNRSPGRARG